MATLNEISYDLLNKLSGGRATNNKYISLDQIKFNINYYRALLIHRDLKKTVMEEDAFYQTINVSLVSAGTGLSKTATTVPKVIRLDHRYPLRITAGDVDIPLITPTRAKFREYDRFTSNDPNCYLKNGYLFVQDTFDGVELTGMFENPSEAYIADGNDPEVVDNLHYPISQDVLQRLSQSIINGNFELFLQIPPDTKADNLPNSMS